MKPYVQSNYPRIADDDYQTIDRRCIVALTDSIKLNGDIVDVCSPNGSGIVSFLKDDGYKAFGVSDAFAPVEAMWVVSNPPYKRGLVDNIIWAQIERINNPFEGVAMLLRNNFDFAKSRYEMFTHPNYYGEVKMMFRPWWSENRQAQPIHNYVWHIWRMGAQELSVKHYWKESE